MHSGSTPAGIGIFLDVLTEWNYDKDPLEVFENDVSKQFDLDLQRGIDQVILISQSIIYFNSIECSDESEEGH